MLITWIKIVFTGRFLKLILHFIQVDAPGWDGVMDILWTWLPNTTVGGRGREVWCNPDTDTDLSSKETKLFTSARPESKWILFETPFRLFTIYFSQYFEESTVGDGEIQNRRFGEKINDYYADPEAFWVNSNFCN